MTSSVAIGGVRDWNTLRQVAGDGYSDGISCLAAIEIVERSNRDSVIGPLNDSNAGRAALLLRDSAFFRLQMMVVRAYATVRHPDDLHLRAAVNFLREHIDEETRPDRHDRLTKVIKLFDSADNDSRLVPLKNMRDKELAHWARPTGDLRPRCDELFGVTRDTCAIWEHLSFGAGTVMIELDNQIDAYRESAAAFWGVWETDS
ncbi:MAG: hypothetical protein MPJ78_14310 [Hyphomicrobiaceae bacterium]|nr:hypothetical protein [Hyphomicrobiaceae bacterium]